MLKSLSPYIQFALVAGAVSVMVVANSRDRGFRDRFLDYLDDNAVSDIQELRVIGPPDGAYIDDRYDHFTYRAGDWEDYVIEPRYRSLADGEKKINLYESDDVRINAYGSLNLDLVYGKSIFTRKRYQENEGDRPVSAVIRQGFRPKQDLQLHIEGTVGDRLTVYVDHDSRKQDNHYRFSYRGLSDDELIRELNAGEIDINFQGSKYAVYDNNTAKGLGVDLTLQKKKFTFKAFGSMTRGMTDYEVFRGNSTPGNIKLSEYQYIRGVYYQIEPLVRYRNTLVPPYPANYSLNAVNVNAFGFEIYMDDQNPYNNYNAIRFPVDGGLYTKLQAGVDYKVNFTTGLVQFLKPLPEKARIFVAYNVLGPSTDPYALRPGTPPHPGGIFAGKILAFVKYGYSLADCPVPSADIYEVRSFYYIGERHLLPNNFNVLFYQENGIMTKNDIASLGHYAVDYTAGIIEFVYREPFRGVLGTSAGMIYSERQPDKVYDYSRYRIRIDYFKEARSFQLNHMNVIPDSVTVKVDGRVVQSSLYTIDYTAGYLSFNSPTNPLVGPQTVIEVRYEYLPFMSQSQEFVGGFRSEYEFSRDLKVGGSLLYSRTAGDETIPGLGDAPTQTVFFEGDATVHLDGRRLAQFANLFTRDRIKEVPLELNGYVEYAKSYKNINTFGKALIDNMEGNEDVVALSMDERDWILSSRPPGGSVRKSLNYFYYRDPRNPALLKGLNFIPAAIDYAIKTGPFNVAFGHIVHSAVSQLTQKSLVLDFNDAGDFASIVSRVAGKDAADLSGVQYLEISYFYTGSADVNLAVEVGRVNEDSDGNGDLDTEDLNFNGVIDTDPGSGFTEDMGYLFNETGHPNTRVGGGPGFNRLTRGDGVLTTEDLNGNGVLDTGESTFEFGPPVTLSGAQQGWKIARVYLDRTALDPAEINILRSVESVRVSLRNADGVRGRVYIDAIKFVSSKWHDERIDGNPARPDQIKVSSINSFEDDAYRHESFSLVMRDLYRSMYGVKNNSELLKEKESALKVEYDVAAGSAIATVTRRFSKPMDFRNYKTLTAWLNFRNFTPGDAVGIIVGSSDTDYLVYRMPMGFQRVWREMKMRLRGSSDGYVIPSGMSGVPDLKRITFVKVVVYVQPGGSVGSFWLDEIYVEDPEILEDSAHWYEGEVKITKPLHRTKGGVPILSDMSVKYIQKGHGARFSTIGKPDDDMSEEYRQLLTSFNIIPNWNARVDYIREDSETDSLNEEVDESRRGTTRKESVVFVSDYVSDINAVPSVKLTYRYDDYRNRREERVTAYDVSRERFQSNHAPLIHVRQSVEKLLGGRLTDELYFNMEFKKDRIQRSSYEMTPQQFLDLTPVLEVEKRQITDMKFNLDYTHRYFFFRPQFQVGSQEIVTFLGQSEANMTDVRYYVVGDYHFPFIYNSDIRFVDRNKTFGIAVGMTDFTYIAPAYRVDIQYFENKFRDYEIADIPLRGFRRSRDARTLLSTNIDLPVYFHKVKKLKFFRTFVINYNRSLYFTESNVPYEGEHEKPLDERYGIARTVGRLANGALNIFQYYPFCFFTGRKNYGRGRDYVMNTFNAPLFQANGSIVSDYTDNLRLLDNCSVNWAMDFDKITVTSNAGIHQICERQNIYGVPGQVITADFEITCNLDLMKIFSFGFFRPNREGAPYHAAFMNTGYKFERNMLITQNIMETVNTPTLGLGFKRDRAGLTAEFGVNLKERRSKPFISLESLRSSARDYWYLNNMPQFQYFKEKDIGYTFSLLFETDVVWIYRFFSLFYRLAAHPIFNLEYSMKINRHEYVVTIRPEPYDLHLISSKLTLDLHKNIRGGLNGRLAVEQYRNRYTGNINKEVLSFEVGGNITILF